MSTKNVNFRENTNCMDMYAACPFASVG